MRTVYLIGNGFDVNLGLPTRYKDFYDHYLELDKSRNSYSVSKLKEHLKQCLSTNDKYWSDLEEAMGAYTMELGSYEELEETYDNLNDEMRKYLLDIENKELPYGIDDELLKRNLSAPQLFLTPVEQEFVNSVYNKISHTTHIISVVNFNYTTTIEKILKHSGESIDLAPATYDNSYKTRLDSIYHIHGLMEEPILGINDSSQIHNEKLRSVDDVQDYLIKPRINAVLGHLIDRKAMQAIERANMICIFGLSLGNTDILWWELVGKRLLNGIPVILYTYDKDARNIVARKIGKYRRKCKTKFFDAAKIPNNKRSEVEKNIIIAPNTQIFDILQP